MFRRLNKKWLLSVGLILVSGGLFIRSLDDFPLRHIADAFGRLQVWQVGLLVLLNAFIFLLFSSRWWLALRALGHRVDYLVLSGYRLVAFGVSYFTLGPQIGGELAQIILLQKRHKIPVEDALASISFDKLLEFLANFTFLAVGSSVALRNGFFPGSAPQKVLVWIVLIIPLPLGYLVGLCLGARPLSRLINFLPERWMRVEFLKKGVGTFQSVELQVSNFCVRQPRIVFSSLLLSLLIWFLSVVEYGLALRFLGASLSLAQILIALTAARLAFLTPIPGGFGALEAGQVFALNVLGFDPALGLSVALLIRIRDGLFGTAGLGWGSILSVRPPLVLAVAQAGD